MNWTFFKNYNGFLAVELINNTNLLVTNYYYLLELQRTSMTNLMLSKSYFDYWVNEFLFINH